jgi:cob(I)alamin adenosyltransferase
MSTIYTKYGDKGFTFTKSNSKTPKNDVIIHLLGEIDELNTHIGYLSSIIPNDNLYCEIKDFLQEIMSILFSMGAYVGYDTLLNADKLTDFVKRLEENIDYFEEYNGALSNFILPTGTPCSAYAHVIRTICRRVERNLYEVEKCAKHEVFPVVFNRLSDYFFSLSRTFNRMMGGKEILWKKII